MNKYFHCGGERACVYNFFHTKVFLSSDENAIHVCSIGGQACAVPSEHVDLTHHVRLLLRE